MFGTQVGAYQSVHDAPIGYRELFEAVFESYKDMGEGEVRRDRVYPVSFIGLHQSSLQVAAKQGLQDFGDSLKKSFGGMFGN